MAQLTPWKLLFVTLVIHHQFKIRSEDQAFYFLGRQDEEDRPLSVASQHDVNRGEQRLTSSTYSFTDTQPQGHSTLSFHQHSEQLPGLTFHEYTNVSTQQIDRNPNNTEFAAQETYAS
jgi:hypothetical protein